MTALFDFPARRTDPHASHVAATTIQPARATIVDAIRNVIKDAGRPLTQFEIADRVLAAHGDRWESASVRTACAQARLVQVGTAERKGRPVGTYTLGDNK
jgi:hypothetical protein